MDKKKLDKVLKCIAFFVALLVFSFIVVWARGYDKGTNSEYSIVCLGDSNLGNVQDETGIVSLLEQKLGVKVLNGAFGGSTMANVNGVKTEYHSVLSMYNLTHSICNKNFGMQKSEIDVIMQSDHVKYFDVTLDKLSKVDFNVVDVLIIEHGVNDYLSGTPIKNGSDPYDTETFCGTIRTVVTMLKEEYPNLRIILSTPTYCAPIGAGWINRYCDEVDYGGGLLEDYVNAEIEVAKELGIEIIDTYHLVNIHKDNVTEYLDDGLHLSKNGREEVASLWADYLLGEKQ